MMSNSDYHCFKFAFGDNYVIWKSFEYQPLNTYSDGFTWHWREWAYAFFYQVNSNIYSSSKFFSKTFTLLVIPICRCYCFFSSFLEYPYSPHCSFSCRARIFFLNSSRSSSFACPESSKEIRRNIS